MGASWRYSYKRGSSFLKWCSNDEGALHNKAPKEKKTKINANSDSDPMPLRPGSMAKGWSEDVGDFMFNFQGKKLLPIKYIYCWERERERGEKPYSHSL